MWLHIIPQDDNVCVSFTGAVHGVDALLALESQIDLLRAGLYVLRVLTLNALMHGGGSFLVLCIVL